MRLEREVQRTTEVDNLSRGQKLWNKPLEALAGPLHPYESKATRSGQVYYLAINLNPAAFLLKAGHRLVLKIGSADDEPDDLTKVKMDHLCSQTPNTITIYHDARYPSRLLLPITQGNIIGTYASGGDISLKTREFMKLE